MILKSNRMFDALLREVLDDSRPAGQALASGFAVTLRRRDLLVLQPGTWLKDEVMNWYLHLVSARCARRGGGAPLVYIWSTFFYSKLTEDTRAVDAATGVRVITERGYCFANVARWTVRAQVDVAAYDTIIVPINWSNTHWALAVVWPPARRILYVDSMGASSARVAQVVAALGRWHDDECADKGLAAPRAGVPWSAAAPPPLQPRQTNCYDCGVFCLMAADWAAAGLCGHLGYAQEHMPALRRSSALAVLRKRVD